MENQPTKFPEDKNSAINDYIQKVSSSPESHLGVTVARSLSNSAVSIERRIMGQFAVETESGHDLQVLCCAYPRGDFYCWWIELGYFFIVALVNEKCKCLGIHSVTEAESFNQLLLNISNQMNIKNFYPPTVIETAPGQQENIEDKQENRE